jgi:hypothetical protein
MKILNPLAQDIARFGETAHLQSILAGDVDRTMPRAMAEVSALI